MNQDLRRMAEEVELPKAAYQTVGERGVGPLYVDQINGMAKPATDLFTEAQVREAIAAALVKLTHGQEPCHWRAVLSEAQRPHQLQDSLHIVGFRRLRAAESWIAEQEDFGGWHYTIESLYTHPAPSQQEDRKPLKREQLLEMARHNYWHNSRTTLAAYLEGARDAEAAHNIKEQQ